MKLFSEKVQPTLTNSTHNILQVESFNEIFFGVYEIEINKSKYPVEKISEHNGNPVVSVPVTVKGVKSYYPFVLVKGKFEVLFNENNTDNKLNEEPLLIDDQVIAEKIEYPQEIEEDVAYFDIIEKNKEILEQIEKAKKDAVIYASKIKKHKLQEANDVIKLKEKALKEMVRDARNSLVKEFVSISNKIKGELIDENDDRFDEIKQTIDNKIDDLSDSLLESIKKDLGSSSIQLESKLKDLVKEIHNSLQPKIDSELKTIALEIVEKVDSIEKNLDKKLSDKADKTLIENVEGELNSVSKANIELNDKINKGVNKALSRVGSIDKKVDELTIAISEEVENKIVAAEENITNYYTEKLKILEEKTFDITEETRKYIINLVTESRNNLIKEIREIKNEKPIEYVVESKGKKQSINSDDFDKNIDKKINSRIDNEVTRLRKYIAVYSGGGSVAIQFADGGTMNGNLNVNGNVTIFGSISASQYLGITGGGGGGGSDVSGLSANWQNTYTTVQANSASWVNVAFISNPITTTLSGNNITTTFTISGAENLTNAGALIVAVDGAMQEPSVDYTVNGNQITFTSPILSGAKAVVVAPNNSSTSYAISPAFMDYREVSGAYTITGDDYTVNCTISSYRVQLPTSSGIVGRIYNIKNSGTGIITLSAYQTQTIDGVNIVELLQYDSLKIQSTNTNWIII